MVELCHRHNITLHYYYYRILNSIASIAFVSKQLLLLFLLLSFHYPILLSIPRFHRRLKSLRLSLSLLNTMLFSRFSRNLRAAFNGCRCYLSIRDHNHRFLLSHSHRDSTQQVPFFSFPLNFPFHSLI